MLARDIRLNNETEEVCAYLIEYMYTEICNLLKSMETK